VVDDDKSILKSLESILKMKGYRVETAETGQEAVEKSKSAIYNLAILDIKLPDMEGTELLVKMHETMPRMMKIMLTGYPSLENAVKSINLGADAFLMKPVNPKELLKVVEEKLREQSEVEMLSEDKVKRWIQTRMEKLKQSSTQ
jgi:DNA-binding NtrC family response regulator